MQAATAGVTHARCVSCSPTPGPAVRTITSPSQRPRSAQNKNTASRAAHLPTPTGPAARERLIGAHTRHRPAVVTRRKHGPRARRGEIGRHCRAPAPPAGGRCGAMAQRNHSIALKPAPLDGSGVIACLRCKPPCTLCRRASAPSCCGAGAAGAIYGLSQHAGRMNRDRPLGALGRPVAGRVRRERSPDGRYCDRRSSITALHSVQQPTRDTACAHCPMRAR